MPHSCAVCGAVYVSLAELDGGACPVCHACKFYYEASQEESCRPDDSLFGDASSKGMSKDGGNKGTDAVETENDDATVSVLIRRPGSYEINLLQMGNSSDRVIGGEKKGVYHLDLHSMVRKRKR